MKNFKTYISELYTIGHTRFYDANANRAKNNLKHGRTDPLDTIPHKGGAEKVSMVVQHIELLQMLLKAPTH